MTTPESTRNDEPSTASRIGRFLKHPLVIACLGALFAAFLLPFVTRQWQDRQKELELKQGLVDQIATTTTTAVRRGVSLIQGQTRAAGGETGEEPAEVYALLRNSWLINRASARSRITTYFPDLQSCWYAYERVVADFLGLVDGTAAGRRGRAPAISEYINKEQPDNCEPLASLPEDVQSRYAELKQKINWSALGKPDASAQGANDAPVHPPGFNGAHAILAELVLIHQDRLIKSIVRSDAKSFYHGPFGWFG